MSRVQLALNVSDIEEAVAFYSKLFGTQPAKRQPGYANFAIADPPLKLVLMEDDTARGHGVAGALNHLGVEVATSDEVTAATGRLHDTGLETEVEEQTTCCFAVQDKVWVSDPDGAPWEVYTVLADAPAETGIAGDGSCCVPEAVGSVPSRWALPRARRPAADQRSRSGKGHEGHHPVAAAARRVPGQRIPGRHRHRLGIAAQNLSPGNIGLELFENAAATATGLFAIILMFGPISGGHFNPVVSFVDAGFGGLKWRDAAAYLPFQTLGCICGAILANVMFSEAAISISTKHRASGPHWLSEVVATVGLILVIFALARPGRSHLAPAAVGAYIGAAYFFTSSTSFANPAITVGRMFSNTFAGIAPSSVPNFISAQVVGGVLAFGLIKGLYPGMTRAEAADVIEPHLRGENDLETR